MKFKITADSDQCCDAVMTPNGPWVQSMAISIDAQTNEISCTAVVLDKQRNSTPVTAKILSLEVEFETK